MAKNVEKYLLFRYSAGTEASNSVKLRKNR